MGIQSFEILSYCPAEVSVANQLGRAGWVLGAAPSVPRSVLRQDRGTEEALLQPLFTELNWLIAAWSKGWSLNKDAEKFSWERWEEMRSASFGYTVPCPLGCLKIQTFSVWLNEYLLFGFTLFISSTGTQPSLYYEENVSWLIVFIGKLVRNPASKVWTWVLGYAVGMSQRLAL